MSDYMKEAERMPEPVATFFYGCYGGDELEHWEIEPVCLKCDALNESSTEELSDDMFLGRDVQQYGDAREAAGYARAMAQKGVE